MIIGVRPWPGNETIHNLKLYYPVDDSRPKEDESYGRPNHENSLEAMSRQLAVLLKVAIDQISGFQRIAAACPDDLGVWRHYVEDVDRAVQHLQGMYIVFSTLGGDRADLTDLTALGQEGQRDLDEAIRRRLLAWQEMRPIRPHFRATRQRQVCPPPPQAAAAALLMVDHACVQAIPRGVVRVDLREELLEAGLRLVVWGQQVDMTVGLLPLAAQRLLSQIGGQLKSAGAMMELRWRHDRSEVGKIGLG